MTEPCYHLGFASADLGTPRPDAVLLCGDPQRSRQIAAHPALRCLCTLSENRGLDSYLLEDAQGRRLLAATSGMGAPSLSTVVNELLQLGLGCIVSIGTCGGIGTAVHSGDLVISSAALCHQGAARDIAPEEYPAAADPFLCMALCAAATASGHSGHLGVTAPPSTPSTRGRSAPRALPPHPCRPSCRG
jgi:uridine phosphorylase